MADENTGTAGELTEEPLAVVLPFRRPATSVADQSPPFRDLMAALFPDVGPEERARRRARMEQLQAERGIGGGEADLVSPQPR